jgi:N-acetylmuramic acid 6-phosphate etherase
MGTPRADSRDLFLLGIEGGGTRTVALLTDAAGQLLQRVESGPGNLRLLTDAQLLRRLREFHDSRHPPAAIAIGLAGTVTEADRARLRAAARRVWGNTPCWATNDLETALAAAEAESQPARQGRTRPTGRLAPTRVLVLAGTGSCCYGRSPSGRTAKVGGWGQWLGDRGSGYALGLQALRTALRAYDHTGRVSPLGQHLLRQLQFNEPAEWVDWISHATKAEVAACAEAVFAAWKAGDPAARRLVQEAADHLTEDALACAHRLAASRAQVEFFLAGGLFLGQPSFARQVTARLRRHWPGARVSVLQRPSVWGAIELARRLAGPVVAGRSLAGGAARRPTREPASEASAPVALSVARSPSALPPTEQRNPRSMALDRLSVEAAVDLMLSEEERLPAALRQEKPKIARAVRMIARALRRGGRLFYVGAGTSGRLGVLDASECPPTFRTPPDCVQGIIAGGQRALWQSVEGAEDDAAAGARAVRCRGVRRGDVVVGIAASGRTPFVWGALVAAKQQGARTVLICFNPALRLRAASRPEVVIAPDVGPEILTGSTRLKAGTATKIILNLLSTLAMVRLGKVVSNLMVDLDPSNTKLRDRAVRIVCELTGADAERARGALAHTGWKVRAAVNRLQRTAPPREAALNRFPAT